MINLYQQAFLQEHHETVVKSLVPRGQTLPPNIPQNEFDLILLELRKVVGDEHVITGSDLVSFSDPYFLDDDDHHPSAAVLPSSTEQVQEILKLANKAGLPLWTCSRGKNYGYGGPAPRVAGSVVLSLHRMNKIIDFDEEFGFIVVEPGVTFYDCYDYLRAKCPQYWMGCPALGWGSVVGNTLDRGHGYTILGDRSKSILSLEAILANGEILRTGQWAATGSPTAHTCDNNFGPEINGLFLQSNLGVVTKLAVKLDKAPQEFVNITFHAEGPGDLEGLVNAFRELGQEGITQGHPFLTNINHFASHASRKHENQEQAGALLPETIEYLKEKYNTGYWRGVFDLVGTTAMVDARFQRAEEVLKAHLPTIRLEQRRFKSKSGGFVDNAEVSTLGAGAPTMGGLRLPDYNLPKDGSGAGAHIDTSLLLPSSGRDVIKWFVKARRIMEDEGADPFIGCHIWGDSIIFVQEYVFDKTQAKERQRGQRLIRRLRDEAKKDRYLTYRSHLDHMDECQAQFDWNNHAYRRFVEGLKDTLDPNGILSPGKQGIWPSSYDQERNLPIRETPQR